ncbi:MAG: MATE family efflux transporter, partial [Lentisphaerae bacterium]|nr:MATE family efflux transporter [Lentisphaerota bacterium]
MLMHLVDALFLSWFSADAVAAVVPSSMAAYLLLSPFVGTVGYGSTLVAHYVGSGNVSRAYAAIWQSIYLAVAAGLLILPVGFLSDTLYDIVGHDPAVRLLEAQYFRLMCWGSVTALLGSAVSGYFSGKGATRTLMFVQLFAFACNAVLDYLLIFGKLGLPRMGVSGAALATILAQLINALILLVIFLADDGRSGRPWRDRAFEWPLTRRLIRFGFPNGVRFGFEMLAWTMFLFFIGRLGRIELAASSIVFRVNGLSFFPIVGLGHAVAILVGQSQGRRDPASSIRLTRTGLRMAQIWMFMAALIYLLFPRQILIMFAGGQAPDAEFDQVVRIGAILLRFVAAYSLVDAYNIIHTSALQAAGDTRWTMMVAVVANGAFLGALMLAEHLGCGLWWNWLLATAFVMTTALIWHTRFRRGRWKEIRVIEPLLPDEYVRKLTSS